jgi:uncharacterized protein (TIGR03437 family)
VAAACWRAILLLWTGFLLLQPAGAAVTSVVVSPTSVSLSHGQTQQFAATVIVTGSESTAVTWSINSLGTISSTGLYTAPASLFATYTVTVTARSAADTSVTGTATITLTPSVAVTAVSPSTVSLAASETQTFTATVSGTTNTSVTWTISPSAGSVSQDGTYTAPSSIATKTTVTISATSVADPSKSASATITLTVTAVVTVAVSPASVSLTEGLSQQFTATVTNATNTAVTWSISPSTGTITSAGLYTAPAAISSTTKVTVTATSSADSSKTATATITLSSLIDVGTGAPSTGIAMLFQAAYNRGSFSTLTSLPPKAKVTAWGSTGLIQLFNDASSSGTTLALVMPDKSKAESVFQVWANLYAYYSSVGVTTAGYPTMDTDSCRATTDYPCTWSLFSNSYALFAFSTALPASGDFAGGSQFAVYGSFYTKWAALGWTNGLGAATSAQTSVTSVSAVTATAQTYASGAIFLYTSGLNSGKYFAVATPIYTTYLTLGGYAVLGFPTSDETTLSTGVHRQSFEKGAIEYTPGSDPTMQQSIASIALSGTGIISSAVAMSLGDSLTVTAQAYSATSGLLTGRTVSWTTSNSSVVTVTASGMTAVLKAVASGTASVTATSEGVVSPSLKVTVAKECCAIGEGAPSAVQLAFQAALTRNNLTVAIPVQAASSRVGSGYMQLLQSTSTTATAVYMVTKLDTSATAYVVVGDILTAYRLLSGPAGTLGYPTADATAGGRQMFENGALAGRPVRAVAGKILTKWGTLGYETGSIGSPVAAAVAFSTFGANSGSSQSFAGGTIYAATAGTRAGQVYLVSGPILARYLALNGPAGDFGTPVGDETVSGTVHTQTFEGGYFDYATGAAAATEHASVKTPGVVASPSSAPAGSRVKLAITGFPSNTTIKVSVTGLSDFLVATATGAHTWEMFLPLTSSSQTLTVHAADTNSAAAAETTVTVKKLADNRVLLTKVLGDAQTGLPGALLPKALRIALQDSAGTAVIGATVTFQASPGAALSVTSAVTDANGLAETALRLPSAEGLALVTVDSPSVASLPITFVEKSAASTLTNYPKLLAVGTSTVGNGTATISQKGALLAAAASMVRYIQNAGDAGTSNGQAEVATLNSFLTQYCAPATSGSTVCDGYLSNGGGEQVVNLWRLAEFTGGGLDPQVSGSDLGAVADWVVQGSPVLLSLATTLNGVSAGGHYVVAIGVAADGSLVIHDPNPNTARTSLTDYLTGFSFGGVQWKASVLGAVRLAVETPAAGRFLVAAVSQTAAVLKPFALAVQSSAGTCGTALDLAGAADLSNGVAGTGLVSRILVCDGTQAAYQVTVGTAPAYQALLTDLSSAGGTTDLSGTATSAYQVKRSGVGITVAPLQVSFTADSVVNAASYTSGLAPGSLMAIFGTGLVGAKGNTSVTLDGTAVSVVSSNTFQINAVVALDTATGVHTVKVQSDYGSSEQSLEVRDAAPAIFLTGTSSGTIVNQNGTLNSSSNPATRGQTLIVYGTGLGEVTPSGSLSITNATVTAVLNGTELKVAFAGLAPGLAGVYQVNVPIPATAPPGLDLAFTLQAGGSASNTVDVSIQ